MHVTARNNSPTITRSIGNDLSKHEEEAMFKNYSWGVNVSIPIVDRGETKARIESARILAVFATIGYNMNLYINRDVATYFSFTTSEVTRGDIVSTVKVTGEISAVCVIEVGTQVSGRIEGIYVDFHSEVKSDQLIALIDASVAELELREAEASLAVSFVSVQRARASLKSTERKLRRNHELWAKNLIVHSEARLSLRGCSEPYNSRTQMMNYTKIRSLISDIVIDRKVNTGQTVATGYQPSMLFNIVKDLTQIQIKTKVDEELAGKVSKVRIAPETECALNVLRLPVASLRFTPSEESLETASIDRRIVWTESKGKLNSAVDVATKSMHKL